MKYLLKMVQNLKNQTLFYFYLGILLMCIPKIFLCKYENQNKPNGASPIAGLSSAPAPPGPVSVSATDYRDRISVVSARDAFLLSLQSG